MIIDGFKAHNKRIVLKRMPTRSGFWEMRIGGETSNISDWSKVSLKIIKYIHNDMVADGGYWDFVFNFTTPNSGTATWEDEAGCTKTEGKNATFIIK